MCMTAAEMDKTMAEIQKWKRIKEEELAMLQPYCEDDMRLLKK